MVDEPTRGIDIGTKAEIYRLVAGLAADGKAVVVISSEMAELIGLCHRIVVMRSGRLVGEVSGQDMTEQNLVVLATGAAEAANRPAAPATSPTPWPAPPATSPTPWPAPPATRH